ncbi:MAG: hypothetical protein IJ608_07295 [Lachnospiraceae bacterium]|nr:hypothetical protein [Lachnospiraceae bacterium]
MAVNYSWYKLDNAATMIPSSMQGSDTRVFRIACELNEKVDGALLQQALDKTLEEFPHFNVVLRRGFFWYYLDNTSERAMVTEDRLPACAHLYLPGRKNLLYRVTYFERRINLEMFHVLADGTGGFIFLKKILKNYLCTKHGIETVTDDDESSAEEKNTDAFRKFYSKERSAKQLTGMIFNRAYQIHQVKDGDMQNHLLEATISSSEFLSLSHKYGTTAGILTVALYIEAVMRSMSERDKRKYPIVISVPVNLRQYFPSETTRNFFGVINISFHTSEYDGSLESIIAPVKESFERQLSKENIRNTMNSYMALEQNIGIKMIPLFIKDPGIRFFYNLTKKGVTATMSNMGKIKLAPELEPYVEQFSGFMSTGNMQITVASFKDKMVLGAVSAYTEHSVLINLFRRLSELGLSVVLATNDYDRAS